MSDSEHDASILGKRARDGPGADISEDAEMKPAATQDDESEDDVGPMPMPMPEGADNVVTKKKRKGVCCSELALAEYGP
jgi:peptidylprolyl isomerase domain and WD repeat-containing protein 1